MLDTVARVHQNVLYRDQLEVANIDNEEAQSDDASVNQELLDDARKINIIEDTIMTLKVPDAGADIEQIGVVKPDVRQALTCNNSKFSGSRSQHHHVTRH